MKIWVVYADGGYEGCTRPLAVFAVEAEKDAFLAGAAAGHTYSMEAREFEVPTAKAAPLYRGAETLGGIDRFKDPYWRNAFAGGSSDGTDDVRYVPPDKGVLGDLADELASSEGES